MKIQYVVIALIVLQSSISNAQGFLGKLKDKVTQSAGGGSEFPKPSDKDAEKDLAATDLEKINFNKDKYNIGGIYIVDKPIGFLDDRAKNVRKTYKKFLIEYNDKDNTFLLASRVSNAADYKPFKYHLEEEAFGKKMIDKNVFFNFSVTGENGFERMHIYQDKMFRFDKLSEWNYDLNDVRLSMLEPGVFVFAPGTTMKSMKNCNEARFVNDDEGQFRSNPFNLLYKPEKDISKWTGEAIRKRLFEMQIMKCGIEQNTVIGTKLPRPGAASSAALFDPAKKQVMAVVKKYLIDNDMAQMVPIYAYGHFDNAAYSDNMIRHPHTGVQVSKGRIVDYIVVCKNTKPNGGSSDYRKIAKGKNVYFHINLAEDNTAMNYNSQNYTGKWYVFNCSVFSEIDESENVMKYQGK